jgi:phenylacetate-CoA ligase
MNLRRAAFFGLATMRGRRYPRLYHEYLHRDAADAYDGVTRALLGRLLTHAYRRVPYYTAQFNHVFRDTPSGRDPFHDLPRLPILTKDILRERYNDLQARDVDRRGWHVNRSGGTTGEPVRLVQDPRLDDTVRATNLFYSHQVGGLVGAGEVRLWGSERDLYEGTIGLRAKLTNALSNVIYLNAFRMTPDDMRRYIDIINRRRPPLIVAYSQAIYELARFARETGAAVVPQRVIISSSNPLYPFMRETVESVFGCRVYNRYGSREVGDMACERPGVDGLWVAPWANYLEIVDDEGRPAPAGVEGNILVTSLSNYAMPLIRYQIGDQGVMAPAGERHGDDVQILASVTGRITDNFRTKNGGAVPGIYFIHMVGVVLDAGDIRQFQFVQTELDAITVRIVESEARRGKVDTEVVRDAIRRVMGDSCRVTFELVDEIEPAASGKHQYTKSLVS